MRIRYRLIAAVAALVSCGGAAVASAAPRETAGTIAARIRVFGAANVNQSTGAIRRNRVILSWFGVTNFAMAIRGHVVLLDAWVPRGMYSGVVPTTPQQLAALRPEYIFIGHSHYDHAIDAVPIAQASGATLVGTAEHCAFLRSEAPAAPARCVAAIPASAAPGAVRDVGLLRGVAIRAVKHLHSAFTPPTELREPVLPPPTDDTITHPPTPEDTQTLLQHLGDPEDGTVLYRFSVGAFNLVWHDSSGPLVDKAPAVLDVLRSLRPVDVELGSIEGFNQLTNGFRDPRTYIEALHPKVFVPTHHDDWQPGITTHAANLKPQFLAEYDQIPAADRPALRYLEDPMDYVRPERLTFGVRVPQPRLLACAGRHRTRARLTGDTADVRSVRFRRGARSRTDHRAPWRTTFRRRGLHRMRITAVVRFTDSATRSLRARERRCRR